MIRKGLFIVVAIVGIVICDRWHAKAASEPKVLHAPTYYIAVTGSLESSDTIRFHGASNLPAGAEISIEVGEFQGSAIRATAKSDCVSVNESGLFRGEIQSGKGKAFHSRTTMRADFNTYSCKQPASVLSVVGKKGQYLGNDNYDNAHDVGMGWTQGMFNNP
jgi:hypothetical protein